MSELSNAFFGFLLEKHKVTRQNVFTYTDYMEFDGCREAIIELSNRGVIENTGDILGTIIVHPPKDH